MLWDFPKKARDDFASLNKAENLQEGLFAIELFILVLGTVPTHPTSVCGVRPFIRKRSSPV